MLSHHDLRRCSLFGGLLEEQIEQILPLMHEEKYETGAEIIAEGSPNDRICFIMDGKVQVVKDGMTFAEIKEGEIFGEMEVLDVMPAAATVKALCPLTLMVMSGKSLRDIYQQDVKSFALILMNLARELSRRLRHVEELMINMQKEVVA